MQEKIDRLMINPAAAFSRSVVVIGAGAGGLVAAREIQREGHRVVAVIEQQEDIGGVWLYNSDIEDDTLGLRPSKRLHASLYQSLRTNLPREIMGFRDYPFLPHHMGSSVDDRRFPRHEEVRLYLSCFADRFDLRKLCVFNQKVVSITRGGGGFPDDSGWRIETQPSTSQVHHQLAARSIAMPSSLQTGTTRIPTFQILLMATCSTPLGKSMLTTIEYLIPI